jgi:uncharacterized protein YukE
MTGPFWVDVPALRDSAGGFGAAADAVGGVRDALATGIEGLDAPWGTTPDGKAFANGFVEPMTNYHSAMEAWQKALSATGVGIDALSKAFEGAEDTNTRVALELTASQGEPRSSDAPVTPLSTAPDGSVPERHRGFAAPVAGLVTPGSPGSGVVVGTPAVSAGVPGSPLGVVVGTPAVSAGVPESPGGVVVGVPEVSAGVPMSPVSGARTPRFAGSPVSSAGLPQSPVAEASVPEVPGASASEVPDSAVGLSVATPTILADPA